MNNSDIKLLFTCADPKITTQNNRGYAIHIREFLLALKRQKVSVSTYICGDRKPGAHTELAARNEQNRGLKAALKKFKPAYAIQQRLKYWSSWFAARKAISVLDEKFDAIYERYEGTSRLGLTLAKKFKAPLILEVNAPFWQDAKYYGHYYSKFARRIDKKMVKKAQAVVVVTEAIKEYLIELGAPAEKITVNHNGVNLHVFQSTNGNGELRKKLELTNKIVVGYVGSFSKWHRLELLVQAARQLEPAFSKLHFLLVGNGADRPRIEALIRESNLTGIFTFTGEVLHTKVPEYLNLFDVAVLPETEDYCSPIKIFEYMAAEKAVLIPEITTLKALVKHEETGLFFKRASLEDLTGQLKKLVIDSELRTKIGKQAGETIREHFTWQKNSERVIELIASISK